MLVSAEQIAKKSPSFALGYRQDAEAEVEHIDGPPVVEVPAVSGSGR